MGGVEVPLARRYPPETLADFAWSDAYDHRERGHEVLDSLDGATYEEPDGWHAYWCVTCGRLLDGSEYAAAHEAFMLGHANAFLDELARDPHGVTTQWNALLAENRAAMDALQTELRERVATLRGGTTG